MRLSHLLAWQGRVNDRDLWSTVCIALMAFLCMRVACIARDSHAFIGTHIYCIIISISESSWWCPKCDNHDMIINFKHYVHIQVYAWLIFQRRLCPWVVWIIMVYSLMMQSYIYCAILWDHWIEIILLCASVKLFNDDD